LEVISGDVRNAFIQSPVARKVFIILGPEFRTRKGNISIIVRALYGLKSAGALFQKHLAKTMRDIGFEMCPADNNTWMRRYCNSHYEYVFINVNDIISISHDIFDIMTKIGKKFKLKKPPSEPEEYLGVQLSKV